MDTNSVCKKKKKFSVLIHNYLLVFQKALVRVTSVLFVGEVQRLRCKSRYTHTHGVGSVCVKGMEPHYTLTYSQTSSLFCAVPFTLSQHALFPHVVDPVCAFGLIPMACAAGGRGGTLPLCRSLIRISDSKKIRLSKSSRGKKRKEKENKNKIEQKCGGKGRRGSWKWSIACVVSRVLA